MNKQRAFVLSGGGARGALQVGALRALMEANICPDLLVGTSAGAINATFVALNGLTPESVEMLARSWREATHADLLPANYVWATVRVLFGRSASSYDRMRDFFIAHGLAPELRFGDIRNVRLFVVAADLNAGHSVVYGDDPRQSVLEAVLASAALPPWVPPIEKDGQLLIDGGAISTLPVEAALSHGATEIVALDLADLRDTSSDTTGWLPLLIKLRNMAERRQTELELALAEARSVPVRHILLQGETSVAVWDFHRAAELTARGYEITRQEIAGWTVERPSGWRKWFARLRPGRRDLPEAV